MVLMKPTQRCVGKYLYMPYIFTPLFQQSFVALCRYIDYWLIRFHVIQANRRQKLDLRQQIQFWLDVLPGKWILSQLVHDVTAAEFGKVGETELVLHCEI